MASDGHLFGGGIADFPVAYGPNGELVLAAGQPVWFYSAQVGGSRYLTGLTDLSGAAIEEVVTDGTGAIGQFRGPSPTVRAMWADAAGGAGPRRLIVAADLGDDIASLTTRIAALESTVATQQVLLTSALYAVRYDVGAGAYPALPSVLAGQRYVVWIGPPAPSGARPGDIHIDTVE